MEILLSPPLAFLIFTIFGVILTAFGRVLAGPQQPTTAYKTSFYASGEESPKVPAAPGYRQFFSFALFFAVLHLGVLMLASGGLTPLAGIYLVGLVLALVALILG